MLKEFREFAVRGNVVDMAVGIIIGAAFTGIVSSLVSDVIMPPVGLIVKSVDFSNLFLVLKEGAAPGPYATLGEAKKAGAVVMALGVFANAVINFFIVAFVTFLLVRSINRLKREKEAAPALPGSKECPYCFTGIPVRATKCPHCTSVID